MEAVLEMLRSGRTVAEVRQQFPALSPGILALMWDQEQQRRDLERQLERVGAGGNGARGPTFTDPPAAPPAPHPVPQAFPAPAPPANPAPLPSFGAYPGPQWPPSSAPHPYPWPPPPDPSAALKPAVDMMAATLTALVEVMKAERAKSPWSDLPQLLDAVRRDRGEQGEMREFVEAFREGLKLGGQAAREVSRDSSPWVEAAREIAAALSAIVGARAAAPIPTGSDSRPVVPVAGAAAPALTPPPSRPAALFAVPGPSWDPRREVVGPLDYGLTTDDDPSTTAAVIAPKLSEDLLMRIRTNPVPLTVEWIMAQREHVPALSNPAVDGKEEWLTRLVLALRGELPPDDDEDGSGSEYDEERPEVIAG